MISPSSSEPLHSEDAAPDSLIRCPAGRSAWEIAHPQVVEWIRAGGYPGSMREDMMRDAISMWACCDADDPAWDVAATVLAILGVVVAEAGAADRAALAPALAELVGALDDCVESRPFAIPRARIAFEHFVSVARSRGIARS